MNLKGTFLGTVAATAALTVSALVAAPAHAFSGIQFGSQINFGTPNNGDVTFNPATGKLDFDPRRVTVGGGTLSFSNATSNPTPPARIQDLTLGRVGTSNTYTFDGSLPNFISEVNLAANPPGPDPKPQFPKLSFDLTSFVFDRANGDAKVQGIFRAIRDDGSTISSSRGVGRFTSQISLTDPDTSWSMTLTAVPTPALVPAAIGFGAAMLRKRKEEEAGKETAEAKA